MQNERAVQIYADPAAVAAAETAKARIQSAYIMAMQRPRNEDQARVRILEACKRPAFAARVEFSKPIAGRQIKGPSIRFAELALREWSNIISDVQVVHEDEKIRRVKITAIDLETNASFSKEVQVSKTVERRKADDREVVTERVNTNGDKVYIVRATDEEIDNKVSAAISKALRNEGLRLIPSDIVDEALDTARATLRNQDARDPAAAKKQILDAFAELGIRPRDLEAYLGHKTDVLTPAELQDLRGIYRAIKDGEATWADYMTTKGADQEKALSKVEELKNKVKGSRGRPPAAKPADPPPAQEKTQGQGAGGTEPPPGKSDQDLEMAPGECPDSAGNTFLASYCNKQCKKREGCPAWSPIDAGAAKK